MKLSDVIAMIKPHLAADAKPDEIKAAILAADKAAKDGSGSGLGARNLENTDDPKAQDAAKDKAAKDEADKKEAEDKAAKDKAAKDGLKDGDDPEGTNDEDMDAEDADVTCGDPSTPGGNRSGGKTTMDSAEVHKIVAKAVAARDALHTAQREVEPILGRVAFDSAPKAYRAALAHLNVDVAGVPDSALPAMLNLAKDRGASPTVAMDSASVKGLESAIPGYGRLR